MAAASTSIRVKHAGATHTLELGANECIYTKVGALLGLPASRVTIIKAGKKLPPQGDAAALNAAIVPNAIYLVTGSRDELPSASQRALSDAKDTALSLYSRLSYDFFVALLFWLWSLVIAFGHASFAFLRSMVVAPDPARPPAARGAEAPQAMAPG